jgi:hypothetical protein
VKLILYRGIAVPSDQASGVIVDIERRGLHGDIGTWGFRVPDMSVVRREIDNLFARPDLDSAAIFEPGEFPGVCACGGRVGADYYAGQHNKGGEDDQPIVIEFEAPLEDVYVDPRDFLCTVFQLWDRDPSTNRDEVLRLLSVLYGLGIRRYFEAAAETQDQAYRIAMCNLASFDEDVVRAHYANRLVIAGRYETLFESAFFVKAPVLSASIRNVYALSDFSDAGPDVTLEAVIRPGVGRDR